MNNKKIGNSKEYIKLSNYAKNYDHSKFFDAIKNDFGYLNDKNEIDNIALYLQICIKDSKPLYLHGYVISSALYKYINDNKQIDNLVVFETGTARGYSAIVMANILKKNNVNGKVYTVDKIGHKEKMYWNCIDDHSIDAPKSRHNLLERWADLRDNYCDFLIGDSNVIMSNLNMDRIHFAFLDGAHFYKDLINELNFVEKKQLSGDVIICDDYTITQFPGICQAIDEFLKRGLYDFKVYFGDDGVKKRGYVYMIKK